MTPVRCSLPHMPDPPRRRPAPRGGAARFPGPVRGEARQAEELGFDSLWSAITSALRDPNGTTTPWEGGRCSPRSPRPRPHHTSALVAGHRVPQPAILAKQAATLDESAPAGSAGLGAGWNETEFRAFRDPVRPTGSPDSRRRSRSSGRSSRRRDRLDGRFYQAATASSFRAARRSAGRRS